MALTINHQVLMYVNDLNYVGLIYGINGYRRQKYVAVNHGKIFIVTLYTYNFQYVPGRRK